MKSFDEIPLDEDQWTENGRVFADFESASAFYDSIQDEALQSYLSEMNVNFDPLGLYFGPEIILAGDFFKTERELWEIEFLGKSDDEDEDGR